ncbi:MAG: methyltransferase family protein, partial [Acidobacteriota bacterium]
IGSNISETVLTRDGQELVVAGPYRRVRHPLYSAGLLLLAGVGLATDSAALLVLDALVACLMLGMIIPREEELLLERFGDQYAEYRRRSGRLLPGPG